MRRIVNTCLLVTLLVTANGFASAEQITLISGNGSIGSQDPYVTVRDEASSVADQAWIIGGRSCWVAPVPGTKWISPMPSGNGNPNVFYLYETRFYIPEQFISASINVTWASDDWCELFLNNNWDGNHGGGFGGYTDWTYSTKDWFRVGENLLTFRIYNHWQGVNPSGVSFLASINYQPVPEPSSISFLIVGIASLAGAALRRRR